MADNRAAVEKKEFKVPSFIHQQNKLEHVTVVPEQHEI